VLFLDLFDITYDFNIDKEFTSRLGFKDIFILGKDIKFSKEKKGYALGIGISRDTKTLEYFIQNKFSAILIEDYIINKKIIADMKEKNIMLCFSIGSIISAYGLERSKLIYKMSKLFDYARSKRINICFASFAKDEKQMVSKLQLIALAKLICSDEQYIKYSLSENLPMLVDTNEK